MADKVDGTSRSRKTNRAFST